MLDDTTRAGPLVIRGAALRIAGHAAGILISIGASAVLIRALGPADFGAYVTVFSLMAVAGGVSEAGMTNLGVREYTTLAGAERDRVMRALLGLRLALAVLAIGAAMVWAVAAGYTSAMTLGAALAGLGLILTTLQYSYSVPLASQLAFGRMTVAEFLRQLTTLAGTVGLALLGAGIAAYLALPIPAGIVATAATVWWIRGRLPLTPAVDLATWRRLSQAVVAFLLATTVGTLYVYVVVMVMSLVTSDVETGYFGVAFRIFVVVAGTSGVIVAAAFPVLARAARDDAARLVYAAQRVFDVTVVVGAWAAVVLAIGAPVAVDVIAGGGFAPSVDVLRIQALAVAVSFVLAGWVHLLISLHIHRGLLIANLCALVVTVVSSAVLASVAGAEGAAVATIVGECTLATGYLVAMLRRRPELRPQVGVVARVGAAVVPAAAVVLIPGLPVLAATIAAAVIFPLAALALGAVPRELIDAIPRRRPAG